MGGTWGISGGAFLVLYAVGLAAVWLGIRLARWRLAGSPRHRSPQPTLDAYEVAMLHGGGDLVATAALARLRLSGVIDAGDTSLRDAFDAEEILRRRGDASSVLRVLDAAAPLSPVDAAVYETVRDHGGEPTATLRAAISEAAPVSGVRRQLEEGLLLYSDRARQAMRGQWLWYVPLIAVGTARFIVGANRGRPVSLLFVLLAVSVWLLVGDAKAPRCTPAGARAMRDLRRSHAGTRRSVDGNARPPDSFVMAIAVFGPTVLWEADPWLAVALGSPGAPPTVWASSGGTCGGGGGGGGGCGGCGG